MIYDTIYLQIKNIDTDSNEVMERHIKNRLQRCLKSYDDMLTSESSKKAAKEIRKIKNYL